MVCPPTDWPTSKYPTLHALYSKLHFFHTWIFNCHRGSANWIWILKKLYNKKLNTESKISLFLCPEMWTLKQILDLTKCSAMVKTINNIIKHMDYATATHGKVDYGAQNFKVFQRRGNMTNNVNKKFQFNLIEYQ